MKWDEFGELGKDSASARLEDTQDQAAHCVWLGPETAALLEACPRPEGRERVFPENLTSQRLYAFWCGIREETGLPAAFASTTAATHGPRRAR